MLGFETSDDCAVYKLRDDLAAVLTLDFFTPVVDDPYEFGAIAAANALSDVFAMGATPLVALNILAFPCSIGNDVVAEVLRGGSDKVREAGAFIVGGHSIDDAEPKYGLSVYGTIHPDHIVRNKGAQPGDKLYYTKRIGTGIMNAALRAEHISEVEMRPAIEAMMELNRNAAEAMLAAGVHAATDVTGFGLAGHLHEMLEASECAGILNWDAIPFFSDVDEYAQAGMRPGKSYKIADWARPFVRQGTLSHDVYEARMALLCDPQTSGGLLVAIPPENAARFEEEFQTRAGRSASLIGEITEEPTGTIFLR